MKVLKLILVLLIAFSSVPTVAQNYSPSRQCRVLIKKQKGYKAKRSRGRGIAKNKKRSFSGAESSRTSVASAATDKKKTAPASNTSSPAVSESTPPVTETTVASNSGKKKKKKQPVEEEVSLVKKGAMIYSGQSKAGEQEEIEQEVNQKLATIKEGETIHLEPVYLKDNNGQLEIVNMKPVFMAAEFGKKGRQVIVNGNSGTPEETTARIERFKQMLVSMGVSPDLISTEEDTSMASNAGRNQIDFTVH